MSLDTSFQRTWYRRRVSGVALLLLPLSWLFGFVARLRRRAYRAGWLKSVRVDRPVIVVGNVTVGGTGKTPLTIWLAEALQRRGKRVGIVLRGYGGRAVASGTQVTATTDWEAVGDEAVLLARATSAIVVAGPDRVLDARKAIELGANVVLSDDGLQHYRLARDCEIAVVDARRLLGNGLLLPAGPLREPASRLDETNCVVVMNKEARAVDQVIPGELAGPMHVSARASLRSARALAGAEVRDLASFRRGPVHAVAGIGNPEAFFDALAAAGLDVRPHAMSDHAIPTRGDITFPDDAPVLMTEKDAVKCVRIADGRHWAVAMDVEFTAAEAATLMAVVERAIGQE
jgi:tetraacyldisaccharide 4'-kinase